jgi:Chaperone of endosialidase
LQLNQEPQQKMKTKNMTAPHLRKSIGRPPLRLAFFLIPLALTLFTLPQMAQAEDGSVGSVGSQNTAEGDGALQSLTANGVRNTAVGFNALSSNTDGGASTAIGAAALASNTASNNTACGSYALNANTTGGGNTATGIDALMLNIDGSVNTATGATALFNNTSGSNNVATGWLALFNNTTGSSNIALGVNAGSNLTTGDQNIDIGNVGVAAEANTIRIGTQGTQTNAYLAGIYQTNIAKGLVVKVDSDGHLGTVGSSERFKDAIKPMDKASEAILALKPVTFRYKKEIDPEGTPQFGLVAEQVEKINPDLVARDAEGNVYTVRYEAVNAMLLNEFLKEHRQVQEQQATIAKQQEQIDALTTGLQKVSARVEVSKSAPQVVDNNQ